MAEINDLQMLDANNTARFPEGQQVPTLNDGARALEGLIARFYRDLSGQQISTGTGAAYQVIPARTITSHANSGILVFRAHVANTGAATILVNSSGLSAKPLRRSGGGELVVGDILLNQIVWTVYNAAGDYYECIGVNA